MSQEEFLHGKGGQAVEGAAQGGGGGVPVPGGVQGVIGCGTQCSGMVTR